MPTAQPPTRDAVTCSACRLRQFVARNCRRCGQPLGITYIEIPVPNSHNQPDESRAFFGKLIRDMRLLHGKTQTSLASSLKTHRTHVCRLERGRVLPALPTFLKALSIFGADKIYIRMRDPDP